MCVCAATPTVKYRRHILTAYMYLLYVYACGGIEHNPPHGDEVMRANSPY